MGKAISLTEEMVLNRILILRGKKVMLDRDLAELYGVETRVLNQAVKRNSSRFPQDFMFQMSDVEFDFWISQFVISNIKKKGIRKKPFVFTELGVAMLSNVLNSETAIEVNIQIVRIFSRMKEYLISHQDILIKLELLENHFLNLDQGIRIQESEIRIIFETLKQLVNPPRQSRKKVGFKSDQDAPV